MNEIIDHIPQPSIAVLYQSSCVQSLQAPAPSLVCAEFGWIANATVDYG